MATIKEDFVQHLLDQAAITAEVSTRVHPNKSPQDTALPRLVVRHVRTTPSHHLRGADTLLAATLEVDCVHSSFGGASDLADIVRVNTDGFKGTMNSSIVVSLCQMTGMTDAEIDPNAGDEKGYPMVTIQYEIYHTVAVGSLIS